MEIFISIDGVLRNTLQKFDYHYKDYYLNTESDEKETFDYGIKSNPVSIDNIVSSYNFQSEEEFKKFLYFDFPIEIFGHAGLSYNHAATELNTLIFENPDINVTLVGLYEKGKAKPATLFFLSKYGCQLETIKFYSTITENWVWENSDIIITSNPKLLEKKIEGKVLIKYETTYNVESYSDYTIKTLEEFKELYKTLKLKQDD